MTPRQQAIEAIRKKLKGVAAPPWFPDYTATAALDALLAALPGLGLAVVSDMSTPGEFPIPRMMRAVAQF